MKIGMLWRIDDDFEGSLLLAESLFNSKHSARCGGRANCAYVNPADGVDVPSVNGVKIVESSQTPRGHLWIGVEGG